MAAIRKAFDEDAFLRANIKLEKSQGSGEKIYFTKDSGQREDFATGSRRDTQAGKTRYDLIPVSSLTRLADLYARGAEKYDDNNWKKGQPYSRVFASMLRHVYAWRSGERTEDHLAAVAWACMALMYFEDYKPELDDLFKED